MVPEFFHFGYLPARNKLVVSQSVSKSVSQSEKKSLHIMYAALATPFGRRALRARLPKNGVAAPAAPTMNDLCSDIYTTKKKQSSLPTQISRYQKSV